MPELANACALDVLLDGFDRDPRSTTGLLRNLLTSDPAGFCKAALHAFTTRASDVGMGSLTAILMHNRQFLEMFCTPGALPREQAIGVFRRLMIYEPMADVRLLNFLRETDAADGPSTECVLDLLDTVSDGRRLVPIVLRMMTSPSARIRSKATLFVGRRTKNLATAARAVQEANSRVRANTIESLYGADSPEVRKLFWGATQDDHNRVVANALLGLYILGETTVIPRLNEMALHPDKRFCRSAVWAIGKTGDQRFSELLLRLLEDPEPDVRNEAFRAMRRIKERLSRAARGKRIQLFLPLVRAQRSERELMAVARDPESGPLGNLPATAFIVRENGVPMMNFSVEEHYTAETLNLGFVVASPWGEHDRFFAEVDTEALRYLGCKRPLDRWAVVRLRTGNEAASGMLADLRISFRSDRAAIEAAWVQPPVSIPFTLEAGVAAALRRMMSAASVNSGPKHVVCIFPPGAVPGEMPAALTRQAAEARVSIHLVTAGRAEIDPAWVRLVEETSGMLLVPASAESIPETWSTLADALISRYWVRWQNWGPLGSVSLRLITESGTGSVRREAEGAAGPPGEEIE